MHRELTVSKLIPRLSKFTDLSGKNDAIVYLTQCSGLSPIHVITLFLPFWGRFKGEKAVSPLLVPLINLVFPKYTGALQMEKDFHKQPVNREPIA